MFLFGGGGGHLAKKSKIKYMLILHGKMPNAFVETGYSKLKWGE